MGAYVDGLPIPNSSIFLTNVASENLKGALEKDCVTEILILLISSPSSKSGKILFFDSSRTMLSFVS